MVAAPPDAGEFIRYSLKELLAELAKRMEGLEKQVSQLNGQMTAFQDLGHRVNTLETKLVEQERRYAVHETTEGHAGTVTRVISLENKVATLEGAEKAGEAVTAYGRWLIPLLLTSVLSLIGTAFTVWKVVHG